MGKRARITSVMFTMVSAALVVSITSCQEASFDEIGFTTPIRADGGFFFDSGSFPPDFGPDDGGGVEPPFKDDDGGAPLVKCVSYDEDEDGGDAAVDTEPNGKSGCDIPPPNECRDTVMVEHSGGYCLGGYCQFDTRFTNCSGGCFRGLDGRLRCNQ